LAITNCRGIITFAAEGRWKKLSVFMRLGPDISKRKEGETKMKKVFYVVLLLSLMVGFSGSAMATGTGDINVGYPHFEIGYITPAWQFQTFEGTPLLFSMTVNNLKTADRTNAVAGPILNGTTSVNKLTVTGKDVAVLNHISGFTLYPNSASSPFPSIWVKGDTVNPSPDPTVYLTGTDANKFYQQGLTINAPYYLVPDYQWTVFVFADKDLLTQATGPATGKVLDPRVATMRWFAWADDSDNDISMGTYYGSRGVAKPAFGYKMSGQSSPTMFNILPLIPSGATEAQKKTFLSGTTGVSLPEVASGYAAEVGGLVQAAIPSDGQIYYNIDRNTPAEDNANNFVIQSRSQMGLVYAAPNNAYSHRTQKVHIQFVAVWPDAPIGVASGAKSCDISLWQRTAP
jgi:hypothetical protein